MGNRISVFFILLVVLSILTIISCSRQNNDLEIVGLASIPNEILRNAIAEYYVAETKCNWDITYNYRSDNFKKLVNLDVYSHDMDQATKDWKLKGIEIQNYKTQGNIYFIHIIFKDEVNTIVNDRETKQILMTSVDRTKWILIDNKPIVLDPGSRSHIPRTINE